MVNDMKYSSKSVAPVAPVSAKATAKAAASRREAEIQMVSTIGQQLNQMVETVCTAAVEARRIDMENLESSDKAAVLQSEGTTLVSLVESNNEAIASLWASVAPMATALLGQMVEVQATRAQAAKVSAEAELLNAQTRAEELKVKAVNAETERLKADTAFNRSETELERARVRARARAETPVNGVDVNEVW